MFERTFFLRYEPDKKIKQTNRIETRFSLVWLFFLFRVLQKIKNNNRKPLPIYFPANTTDDTITIYVIPNNDAIPENNETVTITVTNAYANPLSPFNASGSGTVTLQAMPVLNTNAPAGYDRVKMNGISFGFTPYTPQTEYIAPMPIPEKNWKENEVGIRRNGDYDDGNVSPDWWSGTASSDENDIIRLDITITPVTGIEYRLKTTDSQPVVRFWNGEQKGGNPINTTGNGTIITSDKTVYAEYISSGNNHVTFEIVVIIAATGQELYSEEIVFRPFNSVTCAFVGEFEIAGDPVTSPGINDWVIQELLNGYDVHVYDDGYDLSTTGDCNKYGEGVAFDEICNSINNRGVTDVAIIGYSHGGGTVYNLAWRMYYDGSTSDDPVYLYPPDKILNPYNLVFTSYIDAVTNSNSANFFAENRKPLGTQFHTNQYQTSGLAHGCSIPSSDDDLNRSNLGVVHSAVGITSIDCNPIVMGFLKDRFEQKNIR